MSYVGSLCSNCKRPLAPGERSCKNCGAYRSQSDGGAPSVFSPSSAQTPSQNLLIQPGMMYKDERKSGFNKKKLAFVGSGAFVIICLLMVASFALGRYSAKSENKVAQVNTSATAPTATPRSPQPVPSGVIKRDTLLRCDCDDPIRVTVTGVTVDQTKGGKMIWSMTIYNDSGSFLYYSAHFYLEDQHGKTFIGTGLQQSSNFSAGKSMQVDVTFPLAPVRGVPYTLNGLLIIGGDYLQVNFDPATFVF